MLRYLHAHGPPGMSAVKLLGSFMHAGHLCLVLERLHSSLLDYLSYSASLAPAAQLSHLRQIAFQLLVRRHACHGPDEGCHGCHASPSGAKSGVHRLGGSF